MQDEDRSVDIDTSGPDVEIELPQEKQEEEKKEVVVEQPTEDKTYENERQTKLEDGGSAGDSSEKPVEQPSVQEDNKQESQGKEAEEYSEGVKKRIAKLTKKMREAERQREEALRYADSVKRERDEFKSQANSLDKDYAVEMENRISGQLAAAQAKLTAARQAEDPKAAKEEPVKQPVKQQQASPPDPKAEEWAGKNDWFGTDSAMTYTAFDLHRKLTEEEGIDPKSDEYYEEIDKRIRLEFPHKFGKTVNKTISKPTQTVASATRSPKTNAKSVRLTSSQVAIAKKLGVPLEEYAKQLMNTKEV